MTTGSLLHTFRHLTRLDNRDHTQGLTLSKSGFYHWAKSPNPFLASMHFCVTQTYQWFFRYQSLWILGLVPGQFLLTHSYPIDCFLSLWKFFRWPLPPLFPHLELEGALSRAYSKMNMDRFWGFEMLTERRVIQKFMMRVVSDHSYSEVSMLFFSQSSRFFP